MNSHFIDEWTYATTRHFALKIDERGLRAKIRQYKVLFGRIQFHRHLHPYRISSSTVVSNTMTSLASLQGMHLVLCPSVLLDVCRLDNEQEFSKRDFISGQYTVASVSGPVLLLEVMLDIEQLINNKLFLEAFFQVHKFYF